MKRPDVIIIGAGAAGLSAATSLVEQGAEPVILEARDRIGGRIFTERVDGLSVPIELGAEFIHGPARLTHEIADEHEITTVDIPEERFLASRGHLTHDKDYWNSLDRVMRRLSEDRPTDRSFHDMLIANRRSLSPLDQQLTRQFVEGFYAADATVISEKYLAAGGSPCEDPREMRIGRPLSGYDGFIDAFSRRVRSRVHLGVMVTRVRWKRGEVVVETRDRGGNVLEPMTARAAVITVPVGVLAAPQGSPGSINFDPPVESIDAAVRDLAMGTVVKLVLRMHTPFWIEPTFGERLGSDSLDRAAFFHSRSRTPFQVWWTAYPVRAPVLVAWCGGPEAIPLSSLTRQALEARAVNSLAEIFSMRPATLRKHLAGTFYHDWLNDPFSRGVYAYSRVNGQTAGERLATPLKRTLWFAGEAAARDGRTGTVDGALASGNLAAKQVLRALQNG